MWFSFKIWLLKHQSDSLFFHCKISQFLEIKSPDGYRRYKIPLCTKSDKSQFQGHLSTIVLLVHWKEILYEVLTSGISFFLCLSVCEVSLTNGPLPVEPGTAVITGFMLTTPHNEVGSVLRWGWSTGTDGNVAFDIWRRVLLGKFKG